MAGAADKAPCPFKLETQTNRNNTQRVLVHTFSCVGGSPGVLLRLVWVSPLGAARYLLSSTCPVFRDAFVECMTRHRTLRRHRYLGNHAQSEARSYRDFSGCFVHFSRSCPFSYVCPCLTMFGQFANMLSMFDPILSMLSSVFVHV